VSETKRAALPPLAMPLPLPQAMRQVKGKGGVSLVAIFPKHC